MICEWNEGSLLLLLQVVLLPATLLQICQHLRKPPKRNWKRSRRAFFLNRQILSAVHMAQMPKTKMLIWKIMRKGVASWNISYPSLTCGQHYLYCLHSQHAAVPHPDLKITPRLSTIDEHTETLEVSSRGVPYPLAKERKKKLGGKGSRVFDLNTEACMQCSWSRI